MPEPHLRAADADRSAVAEILGRHMSAGRLTVEEYDERLARAWSARTYGDLTPLTADLPEQSTGTGVATPTAGPAAGHPGGAFPWVGHWGPFGGAPAGGSPLRAAWRSWAATALIVLTVWALSSWGAGELLHFWPMWVIGPWGVVLAFQTVNGGQGPADGDRRRPLPGHRD